MDDEFLEKFPSLEESIKSINKLKKIKWPIYDESSNQDIDIFKKSIFKLIENEFKLFPSVLQPQKCKEFNLNLFRVRELSTFTDIDIFSEHSYPPLNLTKMGRCNFPKTPVFYCSNDPGTSILEVIRENNYKKIKFCISKWKVKPTDEYLIFENFLMSKLPNENLLKDLNENILSKIDKVFEGKLSIDKRKGIIKYLEFLDNSFINDNNYSLSATLAHNSLYRNHETRTDILMYPSKQGNLRGVNLAINPNFVNSNMYLDRLYVVEINSISEKKDKYNITFHNYGTVFNRVILWNKITEKDEKFEEYVKKDFGQSFFESLK